MIRHHLVLVCLCLLLPACGQNRNAAVAEPLRPEYYVIEEDDRPKPGEHLRYVEAGRKAGGLDIAVTTYVHPGTKRRVDLFGVVHVADAPYYEAVERELATYDVVLFEGVKPEGLDIRTWQEGFEQAEGEVSSLQSKLARWFGFLYQLDAIDYTAANFVHADMTAEAFRAGGGDALMGSAETKDGAGGLTTDVGGTLAAVEKFGDAVLNKPSVFRSMGRKMFAETMGTADIGEALDMMPGLGELILEKRNDVVMEKLEQTLAGEAASVAIFYGAAHMPDLEERLLQKLGFERTDAHWLRAWALRPPLYR